MKSPPVQHPDDLAHEMTEAFIRESSWRVEVVHFLLFSPILLVSTLRFLTAYVIPGLLGKVADDRVGVRGIAPERRAGRYGDVTVRSERMVESSSSSRSRL